MMASSSNRPSPVRSNQLTDMKAAASLHENIDSIAAFYEHEEEKISPAQAAIEKISFFFGSPIYFGFVLFFVIAWIAANILLIESGQEPFDEPPYIWLQGMVALNGLLITIAVLIRQNRMADLEEKRAHLNLQVNLLAEQKTSKVIQLLEELRKDAPGIKDRSDPESAAMQTQANPHEVLQALEEHQNQKHEI